MSSVGWENDSKVDALIRNGLLLANQPAEDSTADFDYSPSYLCWEQKLLANPHRFIRKKSRTAFRRTLDVAAAVFITLAVLFGAIIAASPGVRAAVARWFREVFSTHTAYRFTPASDDQALGLWRPAYLPEGYAEVFYIDVAGQMIVDFENENGERITFQYTAFGEGEVFRVDSEDMDITETRIGDSPARVYRAQVAAKMNAIVWIKEDVGVAFRLTSFESAETLINIAESIEMLG